MHPLPHRAGGQSQGRRVECGGGGGDEPGEGCGVGAEGGREGLCYEAVAVAVSAGGGGRRRARWEGAVGAVEAAAGEEGGGLGGDGRRGLGGRAGGRGHGFVGHFWWAVGGWVGGGGGVGGGRVGGCGRCVAWRMGRRAFE